jgi:hypothetical protein
MFDIQIIEKTIKKVFVKKADIEINIVLAKAWIKLILSPSTLTIFILSARPNIKDPE